MNTNQISAAGRVLSQKNVDRLKSAFLEIGRTLLIAKAISSDELSDLFEDVAETFEEDVAENEQDIEASALKEHFQRNIWHTNLKEALYLFQIHVRNLEFLDPEGLKSAYGETSKKAAVKNLISDLETILTNLFDDIPEMGPIVARVDPVQLPESVNVFAEKQEDSSFEEPEEINLDVIFEQPVEIITEVKRRGRKSTVAASSANKLPIKGVLFRVDEPSETAPSKGSQHPLFIPRAIAEQAKIAINASNGLPLDADNSLSRHANKDIVGVMTKAEIVGDDFIVSGHLFPWSQEEKVKAIASNQEILGMSLNAHASGYNSKVNGVDVFLLTHLDILGANILFKDRATYQKTRLLREEIAASSSLQTNYPTKDMDYIEYELQGLKDTLRELAASSGDTSAVEYELANLKNIIASQQEVISEIQAERRYREAEIQAHSAELRQAAEREALLQAVTDTLDERLSAQRKEFLDALNPHRVPQRITRPLVSVAASGREESNFNQLEKRLIAAQAQLAVYEEQGIVGTNRISLTEEVHALKSQLGLE